jgi:hypothetical protein
MKETTIIAKKILKQMILLSKHQVDMNMFMGLGFSLGIVFETTTGRSIIREKLKAKETMLWAYNLPQIPGHEIEIDLNDIPSTNPASLLV